MSQSFIYTVLNFLCERRELHFTKVSQQQEAIAFSRSFASLFSCAWMAFSIKDISRILPRGTTAEDIPIKMYCAAADDLAVAVCEYADSNKDGHVLRLRRPKYAFRINTVNINVYAFIVNFQVRQISICS